MSSTRIWSEIEHNQSRHKDKLHSLERRSRTTTSIQNTANMVLVDKSTSTAEAISFSDQHSKLTGEKEAVTMLISNLPVNTYLGIITFGDTANVILPMCPLKNKLAAIKIVQSCNADGWTTMQSALTKAYKQFAMAPYGYLKRCYVVTDGRPTDGNCYEIANRLKESGVQLHFIGFGCGSEINEQLMIELASMSNTEGKLYKHFESLKQLSGFMRRQSQTITN
jgi:uncharacterized protein YegL